MTSSIWVDVFLPLATALIGWFGSAYRTKQKKEKDTLDNIQQILEIQKGYITEQQKELESMRDINKRTVAKLYRREKSIRQANGCKYIFEGDGCPVIKSEENLESEALDCVNCKHNTANDTDRNKNK